MPIAPIEDYVAPPAPVLAPVEPPFDPSQLVTQGELRARYVATVGESNGSDDTAALLAEIADLGTGGGAGVLRLRQGRYKIVGKIVIPAGVTPQGEGNNISGVQPVGTSLELIHPNAGVEFQGSGGVASGFTIDGTDTATHPLVVKIGAQRTFVGVDVENSAQDNWTIEKAQNIAVVGCTSQSAARDNLRIDLGAGGLSFTRFESNDAGRHGLRVEQSGASDEVYPDQPRHISFRDSIFERGAGTSPQLSLPKGGSMLFDNCVLHLPEASTVETVDVDSLGVIEFHSCVWFGGTAAPAALTVAAGGQVVMTGRNQLFVVPFLAKLAAGGKLHQLGSPLLTLGGQKVYTADTNIEGDVLHTLHHPMLSRAREADDRVFDTLVDGEAGGRFRILANGSLLWDDGTGFAYVTRLFRRAADGHLGTSTGLTVGGPFAANGVAPVGRYTLPAAAVDAAMTLALANAIRQALIENGLAQ